MRAAALVATLALAAVGIAGCGGSDKPATDERVTVDLSEVKGSGESGTASLTAVDSSTTRVVIELESSSAKSHPTHIHAGGCEQLDPKPAYALTSVEGGKSETSVNASLDDLRAGDFAINVHKSREEIRVYAACGDIP